MNNFNVINHPLVQHKIGRLRDKNTQTPEFRLLIKELSVLLAFEATRDLQLQDIQIETPMAATTVKKISDRPVLVSIMRAGNGMLDALLEILPNCSAGHIGIYRDKFINNTVEYYFKIPENSKDKMILVLDPLLATGDTMIAALDRLKQYNVGQIKVINIIAFEKGAQRVLHFHP
ncbi:MAG: uracil phosphoribosyltransferase, partial [Bdellovibrionota bacterium]